MPFALHHHFSHTTPKRPTKSRRSKNKTRHTTTPYLQENGSEDSLFNEYYQTEEGKFKSRTHSMRIVSEPNLVILQRDENLVFNDDSDDQNDEEEVIELRNVSLQNHQETCSRQHQSPSIDDFEEFEIQHKNEILKRNRSIMTFGIHNNFKKKNLTFRSHSSNEDVQNSSSVVSLQEERNSLDSSFFDRTDSANLLDPSHKDSMDDDACSFQRHSQDEEHHTHHFYQAHWYSTSPQAIWKHMTDAGTTLLPHILLTSNLILFAGFFLLSPHAMKIFRPIIFGVFRIAIMIVCMLPLMLYFDRKYSFRSEKSLRRRREAYLSTLSATKESCNYVIYVCYSLWYYLFYTKFFDSILRKLPKKKQAKILALCGFIIIMNQITFLSGYYLTNATVSGSMSPLTAVITCSLSMLIGNEPKSWLKLFGVVTSVCGAIAMVLTTALLKQHSFSAIYSEITSEDPLHHYWNPYHPGAFSQSSTSSVTFVLGVFCLMLSTLANSLYLLLQKKLLNKGVPPISVTFWSFFFGYGILVIVGFFFLPISWRRIDWMSILGLFYAGCPFGAFQFVFQTKASSMTTPTMVGIYSTMSPMVGLVTGLAFLGEKTSPFVLFGGSFIIIGVVFVLFARWRETHTKQQKLFSLDPNGSITMKQDGSNMLSVSSGESLSSSTNQILLSSKNERSTTTSNSTCSQNLSVHEEAIHSKV